MDFLGCAKIWILAVLKRVHILTPDVGTHTYSLVDTNVAYFRIFLYTI